MIWLVVTLLLGAISGWGLVALFTVREVKIRGYLLRQVDRYPLESIESRIYSDVLTVIALDGVAEDRFFGGEIVKEGIPHGE